MSEQRGITLIESLLALAILSFGLLGMLALTGRALSDLRAARSQNRATVLASDLANRIRSSGGSLPAGSFDAWRRRVARELANGEASVSRTASDRLATFVIHLSWAESRQPMRVHSLEVVSSHTDDGTGR
jgi:type IV pilus assembly protein PilV